MFLKVERVTGKTGCTSCTNWTISFEVTWVSFENSSITKGISFFEHILTLDFFCIQYAPFKATSSIFNPFLTSFAIFHAFHDLFYPKMTLNLKSTTNELWKGWNLAWCQNFTHIACAKMLRGLREKLDALRLQLDNLLRSIRVSDENSSITKGFYFFLNIF